MAQLIQPDGTTQEVQPQGKHFTLQYLQRLVGGYVQFIRLADGWWLAVDEDGKLKRLPINAQATVMAALSGDFIVGTAVVLSAAERKEVG
jgi:hypothetical protein